MPVRRFGSCTQTRTAASLSIHTSLAGEGGASIKPLSSYSSLTLSLFIPFIGDAVEMRIRVIKASSHKRIRGTTPLPSLQIGGSISSPLTNPIVLIRVFSLSRLRVDILREEKRMADSFARCSPFSLFYHEPFGRLLALPPEGVARFSFPFCFSLHLLHSRHFLSAPSSLLRFLPSSPLPSQKRPRRGGSQRNTQESLERTN